MCVQISNEKVTAPISMLGYSSTVSFDTCVMAVPDEAYFVPGNICTAEQNLCVTDTKTQDNIV